MTEPVYTLSIYWKDWWDGAEAAWRAKGAASSSDALVDLTGNGNNLTYDNYASTDWTTANGWAGNGTGYFDTGILPQLEQTIYIAYSGMTSLTNNAAPVGTRESISGTFRNHLMRLHVSATNSQTCAFQGTSAGLTPREVTGVVAMNKAGFWVNGVEYSNQNITDDYTFTANMFLMAQNLAGTGAFDILDAGYIVAACIVNATDSDAVVKQRMAAMEKILATNANTNTVISRTMLAHKVLAWSSERGQYDYFAANGRGFEPAQIGRASFTIDNSDGTFDPYNTEGELYGYIEPDKFMQFTASQGLDFNLDIFSGTIRDIKLNRTARTAEIICEDMQAWLNARTPATANNGGQAP
jgi:hypothetical protein